MRADKLFVAMAALALVPGVSSHGEPGKDAKSDRIAVLIKQLGDDEFAKREVAGKELEDIGARAVPALRAAAASSDDLEIRRCAVQVLEVIAVRAADAAGKRQLAAVKGKWAPVRIEEFGTEVPLTAQWKAMSLTFEGDRWGLREGAKMYQEGVVNFADVASDPLQVNMRHTGGPAKDFVGQFIWRIEGDTLHYAGAYPGLPRPAEFSTKGGRSLYITYKRIKE